MSEFDKFAYERDQEEKSRQAGDRLRNLVTFDEFNLGPAVEFLCPKGHSLKRYRAELTGDEVVLVSLPGESPMAGPVASDGSPWRGGGHVCDMPGCPEVVDHPGACAAHGGRAAERVHHVRTRLKCRRCSWEDGITTARLLKVYGTAVHLGLVSIPISGSAPTRR